jgi:hypothetical protein
MTMKQHTKNEKNAQSRNLDIDMILSTLIKNLKNYPLVAPILLSDEQNSLKLKSELMNGKLYEYKNTSDTYQYLIVDKNSKIFYFDEKFSNTIMHLSGELFHGKVNNEYCIFRFDISDQKTHAHYSNSNIRMFEALPDFNDLIVTTSSTDKK